MLLKQRCLFERRCHLKVGTSTSAEEDQPAEEEEEEEELLCRGREMAGDHSKFVMGLPGGYEYGLSFENDKYNII